VPTPALSAAAALDLWERAEPLAPHERALALARLAEPTAAAGELARLPLGRRDALLLRLRAQLAGPALQATAPCPRCGEELELSIDVDALLARQGQWAPPAPVELDGFVVSWRSPTSEDVAAAAVAGDAASAERVLLARCVTAANSPAGAMEPAALPEVVRAAVADAMAAADPLAEVLLELGCPACTAAVVVELDLAGFVWAELGARTRRLLRDVDVLARTYGWSEAEVLALGEQRRGAYVRLALGGAS
jgi:hypothetical protein